MTRALHFAAVVCLLALLSGCNATDPYNRPYSWHPTGANAANLAAMAANPADIGHGRGTSASDGATAAAAVDRLRRDHVKPLQDGDSNAPSAAAPATAGLTAN